MTGFHYPPDDPGVVRADAATWRAARESLGSAGSSVRSQAATTDSAWEGAAARAAVAQLERTATRHDEAAAALDEAAAILDRYAAALDEARADIDRLNVEAAAVQRDYQADPGRARAVPVDDGVLRSTRLTEAASSHQAAMTLLGHEHDAVLRLGATTAGVLGSRLQEIAARAHPAARDPNRGPAEVVAQNADESGYVDWVTHLVISHPNLTAEQRLWVLDHREQLTETLDLLVGAAFNSAVTDDVVANYLATMETRNTRQRLSNAFDDNRFEFITALLLPTVVSLVTSREFRNEQQTAQLTAAVIDAATTGLPPAQYVAALSSIPARSPAGAPSSSPTPVRVIETPERTFVVTPRGTVYDIPAGWVGQPTRNGQGIVFQRPGATRNSDSIRIMEPTDLYPNGYVVYYNSSNQPLTVSGRPGPRLATHISEDFIGRLERWPQ